MSMPRYELICVYSAGASNKAVRRAKAACNQYGLSFAYEHSRMAVEAAVVLSGMQGVDRVVMTRVTEENEGTWRNGSKS